MRIRTHAYLWLTTALLALFFSCGAKTAYTDGTFTGSGRGHHGEIVTEVTVTNGTITAIEVTENPENKVLSASVYETLTAEMITANSPLVDAVSGASDSSRGFITAVTEALSKSNPTASHGQTSTTQNRSTATGEEHYDVVIIGAGGAGLTAGVTAAQDGASVVVLEKMPAPGGNTLISGGGLNVPGSWMQAKHGITDSVERYTADTLAGGDNEGEPELVATLASGALDAANWLREEIGIVFLDRVQQFGGHSVPRAIIPEGNTGEQMILKLLAAGKAAGMELQTRTTATSLVTNDEGRVTGVRATGPNGEEITFHAARGVVIAAGGFGSNTDMRVRYNPEFDEKYMSTCLPGITGDGVRMGEEIGANLTDMSFIQTYPTCNPNTGIISYVANSRFYGAILVNERGERFVNEMGRRDHVSKSILSQTGKHAFLLWNGRGRGKERDDRSSPRRVPGDGRRPPDHHR